MFCPLTRVDETRPADRLCARQGGTDRSSVIGGLCNFILFLSLLLVLGCTPAGPKALLRGKKLLERGKYDAAIQKFTQATEILNTNANAWNYLGLAYHFAHQPTEAEKNYRQALALDHDLTEAHYNLGCLLLEENKPDAAKTEFIAFTLHRPNAADGFVKLGMAELALARSEPGRVREITAGEKAFSDALRLEPHNAEALNGMGMARILRARPEEALQYFENAIAGQPKFAPAILNSAIVMHQYQKNPAGALKRYRQYASLNPPPPDAALVRGFVSQLEKPKAPPVAATSPAPPAIQKTTATNPVPLLTKSEPRSNVAAARPEPKTNLAAIISNSLANPLTNPASLPAAPPPARVAAKSPPPDAPAPNVEVVKVPAEQSFKLPLDTESTPSASPATVSPKSEPATNTVINAAAIPRYGYIAAPKIVAGKRPEAQREFAKALAAEQAHHVSDAIAGYQRATTLDPAYFEAYYNLALTQNEAGDSRASLRAYEYALAIRPDSADARYNFALGLKQAGYLLDSVSELEKMVTGSALDPRALLALANLYSQQLHQNPKARQYYEQLLAADPHNPEADKIRYWLAGHP